MQMDNKQSISIIIPTHNEEKDISLTLKSLMELDYLVKQIIVVDDSTDHTPEIVETFSVYGVELLKGDSREGRCGARNLGILEADGEIVVILNADVLLPKNFLSRIAKHYLEGADYVLVESTVANPECVFARFIDAEHRFEWGTSDQIDWTEGFSCRRAAIIDVGLFPVGYSIPISAGEDGFVGSKLRAAGYKKIIDRSIVVRHIAPCSFSEFWQQQIGRGKGLLQVRVLFNKLPLGQAYLRVLAKTAWTGLRLILIFPLLFTAWNLFRLSSLGWRNFVLFLFIAIVQTLAQLIGEWISLVEISKRKK